MARGTSWDGLMDRAGAEISRLSLDWLGPRSEQRVLVLAGPGNNGGDALVVARHLAEHGWAVRCLTWSRKTGGDERLQAPLRARNTSITPLTPENLHAMLSEGLRWASVVIDGLLGIGLKRDISGELAEIIRQVAASGCRVIAVDIPTGVDSDTGAVRGVALPADLTATLGHLKYGHVLEPGARLSGKIVVGDIGLNPETSNATASGRLLDDRMIAALLPARPEDANKGTFGKAMIVAGSVNYIGAATLATEGALRVGAGLVTLACAGDLLPTLAVKLTESTFLPLASDLGVIIQRAVEKLLGGLQGYNALLVGCGIGQDKETVAFLNSLLSPVEAAPHMDTRPIGFAARLREETPTGKQEGRLPPLVLDGDALNILAGQDEWWTRVPEGSVLTPHPGEMARLTRSSVEEVQSDRVGIARACAVKWKQIVVLKGAGTVIAEPGGTIYVSPFANPALATAGSGDVLAGAIAGLIAQGLKPLEAACTGVYLHGMAGESLRQTFGAAGGLAGDLPLLLVRAQKQLRDSKTVGA